MQLARALFALLLALPALAGAADFPAGTACAALGASDIVSAYADLAALPGTALAGLVGKIFTVRVVDPAEDRWDREAGLTGQRLIYRMGRNHVTEGWNWHPEADPARADYYRYKYLPLGQRESEVRASRNEFDPAAGDFTANAVRRDAYYFAFDNPYDFYPRNGEDNGFSVEVPAVSGQVFHLVARGRFAMPVRAESTTYWRAHPAQPVDLTLKNRYFMGRLETIWFCDDAGRILGRLGQ